MLEIPTLLLVGVAGVLLGMAFFGGLWWTVRKALSSEHPALWFLTSLLLRTGLTLIGFWLVADGHWERLLVCLVGFVMGRHLVAWRTRSPHHGPTHSSQEAGHAT